MKSEKVLDWLERLCRVGLGGMFVYSAWGKVADPGLFATTVMQYELLPEFAVGIFSLTLPMLEMLVGHTTVHLFEADGGQTIAVVRGLEIDCGCFGISSGGGRKELVLAIVRDLILLLPTIWLMCRRDMWLHESNMRTVKQRGFSHGKVV